MNPRYRAPVLAIVALLVLASMSVFKVAENESVVLTRMGEFQPSGFSPGLHWCWPFETVTRTDRRVLIQKLQGESFLTSEQQGLSVDIDLAWRVRDAAAYQRAVMGEEQTAMARLADVVRGELKASYAQQTLAQIIAAPRGGVSAAVFARFKTVANGLGIEVLDAYVKRIDPTDEVATSIYGRMQAAYAAQSKQVRAESSADADRLRAEAERNRAEILATANREAQRLRGEGDAQAAAIYSRAYGTNPEFAAFYRSLQAYRASLGRDGDILVIEPEGEFYKYLHNPARH